MQEPGCQFFSSILTSRVKFSGKNSNNLASNRRKSGREKKNSRSYQKVESSSSEVKPEGSGAFAYLLLCPGIPATTKLTTKNSQRNPLHCWPEATGKMGKWTKQPPRKHPCFPASKSPSVSLPIGPSNSSCLEFSLSLFSFLSSSMHLAILTSETTPKQARPAPAPGKVKQLSEAFPCYTISRINSRMLPPSDASTGKTWKVHLIWNLPVTLALAQKAKSLPNSRKINHFKEITDQEK